MYICLCMWHTFSWVLLIFKICWCRWWGVLCLVLRNTSESWIQIVKVLGRDRSETLTIQMLFGIIILQLVIILWEILWKQYLSTLYTNHCIRATCITNLDQRGIEARHIMSVSGHKSETSIKSYSRCVSETNKQEMLYHLLFTHHQS